MELRPMTEADFDDVCAVLNRADAFDGVARLTTVEELADDLDDEHVVLASDTRVATVDGVPAGYASTLLLASSERLERCYVFGQVDPARRGQGVGRALLGWGMGRGTEQLRSTGHDLPKFVRVDAYDFVESAHRLYRRLGFEPIRWFEELLRPLTALPAIPTVDGVRIEPWPLDRDDELREVKNLAFADHWGSTPTPPSMWQQMVDGFGSRRDLSFVALDATTDRPVAVCLNHRYPHDDDLIGRRDGWIETLGTLAEWRGRGIASALMSASLHAFASAGLTHASISVDSDSPTGAARLYRALGFEPQRRSITHEIRVG